MSSKSVSLPKSQNKQLGGTGNLKIYTSVGWNKTKKQWDNNPNFYYLTWYLISIYFHHSICIIIIAAMAFLINAFISILF